MDLGLNVFYAIAEILMLIFLIYIALQVYKLNKLNDKSMIVMVLYLNLATFGKYHFFF